jgi:hypothetical protein
MARSRITPGPNARPLDCQVKLRPRECNTKAGCEKTPVRDKLAGGSFDGRTSVVPVFPCAGIFLPDGGGIYITINRMSEAVMSHWLDLVISVGACAFGIVRHIGSPLSSLLSRLACGWCSPVTPNPRSANEWAPLVTMHSFEPTALKTGNYFARGKIR